MGEIKSLAPDVIEKIAAGEVVERPASVAKELIENALDAGARSIAVDVAGGGREHITVMDDGAGMDASDLAKSVERHATSKIGCADDLWRIGTMGFRGEALAAIGAVSKLEITSRPNSPDSVEGGRIVVEGGLAGSVRVAGCAGGTRVAVSDLFYNVPARRKFLRSAGVEAGHICDVVARYAIAYPGVRFDFTVDGARRLSLPAQQPDVAEVCSTARAAAVIGERIRDHLAVSETAPDMSVKGIVAPDGRRSGKDVHLFLNGRPVKDRMLMHAIVQAMGERQGAGGYPAAALWIWVEPEKVDVNVHPAKREVRFADGGAVYSFLMSAVRKQVSEARGVLSTGGASGSFDSQGFGGAAVHLEAARADAVRTAPDASGHAEVPADAGAQAELVERGLTPLGQYALAYLLCEDPDGSLVLIDQHAAHERLGFEALRAAHASGSIPQQRLLVPESVELGERAAAYIEENISALADAGFDLEPFGAGTIVVKAVPEIIGDSSVAPLLEKLACEFEEMGCGISVGEAMERVFAVIACHRQVRAGDRLGPHEQMALVRDIERGGVTSCPHGRPAVVRIDKEEVEKWFHRK